jgi:transcription elongation factor SPT4
MSAAADLGYTTPNQARSLRACMVCSIIQLQSVRFSTLSTSLSRLCKPDALPKKLYSLTLPQKFQTSGCPNCESLLQLAGNADAINDCTSSNFNGCIALADPASSWVAKWQRLESYAPGMYAVQVIGKLTEETLQSLEDAGVRFVPRDGTRDEEVEG